MKKIPKPHTDLNPPTNPGFDPRSLYTAPWGLAFFAMVVAIVIFLNNTFPIILLYYLILFLGVGIILRFDTLLGSLVGVLLIAIWVASKILYRTWTVEGLAINLIELAGVFLTYLFSALYHRQASKIIRFINDNQRRMKSLDIEDRSVGLLKAKVGLLRLNEEEERSSRYERPFSLILIHVRPMPGKAWGPADSTGIMHILADMLKAKTRDVDIPFFLPPERIALILPETDAGGAKKVVNNIVNSMMNVRYTPHSGKTVFMWEFAQFRFGFATFLGKSSQRIHLLDAAEQSLKRNLKTNPDELYQNIFIEWEMVGERPNVPLAMISAEIDKEEPEDAIVPLDKPVLSVPNKNDKKSLVLRMIERLRSM